MVKDSLLWLIFIILMCSSVSIKNDLEQISYNFTLSLETSFDVFMSYPQFLTLLVGVFWPGPSPPTRLSERPLEHRD